MRCYLKKQCQKTLTEERKCEVKEILGARARPSLFAAHDRTKQLLIVRRLNMRRRIMLLLEHGDFCEDKISAYSQKAQRPLKEKEWSDMFNTYFVSQQSDCRITIQKIYVEFNKYAKVSRSVPSETIDCDKVFIQRLLSIIISWKRKLTQYQYLSHLKHAIPNSLLLCILYRV